MPTIQENLTSWDKTYNWSRGGEEWSKYWGSSRMQWYGTILPRISAFVPAETILEIAPGYGRWTAFLKDICKHLIIVDLSERCIDACRQRFADCSHISYFVNDGMSLEMVGDHSIDFIFSFDSLVHAEEPVIRAYATEFAKKLKPNGAAFIHHSNVGEYANLLKVQAPFEKLPRLLGFNLLGLLGKIGLWDNVIGGWRARSMTAAKMEAAAEACRLRCVIQELINWGTSRFALIDCLSTIVPQGSQWSRQKRALRNTRFMAEAKRLSRLSYLYDWPPDAD